MSAARRPPADASLSALVGYLILTWLRKYNKSTVHTCEFGDHCGRLFCRGLPRGRAQQLLSYEHNGGVLEIALLANGHRPCEGEA